jgi:hypothetical protein
VVCHRRRVAMNGTVHPIGNQTASQQSGGHHILVHPQTMEGLRYSKEGSSGKIELEAKAFHGEAFHEHGRISRITFRRFEV